MSRPGPTDGIDDELLDGLLVYCERKALAPFRAESHLFAIEEDDLGGSLVAATEEAGWSRVMFGFRELEDRRIVLAVWHPDFVKLPESTRRTFLPYVVDRPEFADHDWRFRRWHERYINGDWEVENGPRIRLEMIVDQLNALWRQGLGVDLFRFHRNPLINYPLAENTEEYFNACLELYRFIVDGLKSEGLVAMASRCDRSLSDRSRTLGSLKELLPEPPRETVSLTFKRLADARNRKHGVPSAGTTSYPAFTEFEKHLNSVALALSSLLSWAEEQLGTTGQLCMEREASERSLPRIDGPPHPSVATSRMFEAVGKTIERIEVGARQNRTELHESEALILHFSDGSQLGIDTGSNAWNLSVEREGLRPSDFHVDLRFQFVPSLGITGAPDGEPQSLAPDD